MGWIVTSHRSQFKKFEMKTTRNDYDYRDAVNYSHDLYNPPVTVTYKRKKYIIGAGSSDEIDYRAKHGELLILSTNEGLGYAALTVIGNGIIDERFFDESSLREIAPKFWDYTTPYQIRILSNYF